MFNAAGYLQKGRTDTNDLRLTNVSLQYRNPDAGFVYNQGIFTPVSVTNSKGKIVRYNQENIKDKGSKVAPGQEGGHIFQSVRDSLTYDLNFYKLNMGITDEEVAQSQGSAIDPFVDGTNLLTESVMIDMEADASAVYESVTASKTLSGTGQWNDYSNSDPVVNIREAKTAMAKKGRPANIAVMNMAVYETLIHHPAIVSLRGANERGFATQSDLVNFLGVQKIFVASAIYDSSKLGSNTKNRGYIWNNDFWFAHVPQAQSKQMTTFGFYVTKPGSRGVIRKYNELAQSTILQVRDACDFVQADTDNVYRIASAVDSTI